MITLTWSTEPDHHSPSGVRHVLRTADFPAHHFSPLCADDRVGVCSICAADHSGRRPWRARFFIGYDEIWVQDGTAVKAMRLLEQELCKRSIGLFGADDLEFVR